MRQSINFNAKWAFTKMADSVPSELPEKWDWVNLPHTWNAIDGQDGGNDYYRGACYYAKKLDTMDLPKADRYYLEICGANSSADVYVNGSHLAHHDGGYSTWRVDMTGALSRENLIVIRVDNSPNETVYPQMADFTFYGGIYRNVNILCVSASHFDLEYYGGPGLAVTPEIIGKDAKVTINAYVSNKTPEQILHYVIRDRTGYIAAEASTADTVAVLEIRDVHRWHGRKDPYLYTAEIELVENGTILDTVSARFGCRTFRIDPENGFILNGEEYPLRGVSRHQDRWGIGNALLPEHHKEDIDLIYEVGATTIRLAHYQHDQYFYDLCDEKGFVVWAEIPYISKHMPGGRENTISQMKELITQNYNHASIVVWGLSNEISMNGTEMCIRDRLQVCHNEGRVGQCFCKYTAGVFTESCAQLVRCGGRGNEGKFDAQLVHSLIEQVKGAAVNSAGTDHMTAGTADIQNRNHGCGLTGCSQHCTNAAFKSCQLLFNTVQCGIAQTGIEKAVCLQVKQITHFLGAFIGIGSALNNGHNARFTVSGRITCVDTSCIGLILFHF